MAFFDTQIISYVFKGNCNYNINRGKVSSIVLNEFLGLYVPCSTTTAKCYINPISPWHLNIDINEIMKWRRKNNLSLCKRRTDQISIYLGNDFASIVEFNGLGLQNALKNKDLLAFKVATSHYKKYEQKKLLKRVQFLFDLEIICCPLNQEIINNMYTLFRQFVKKYSVKEHFRNSINDLLILATALYYQELLVTTDSLLCAFMEEESDLIVQKLDNSFIGIYKLKGNGINKIRKDSTKYINNSLAVFNRKKF